MNELIEYEEANDEVRAVYDDIRATRQTASHKRNGKKI